MSCGKCGAPVPDGTLVCEFCGVVQRSITDPKEEVQAVHQLGAAWNKLSQESASGSMLGKGHPMRVANQARNFWSAAYTPTSVEGLIAAAEQAAMLMQDQGSVMQGVNMTATSLNPILLSRMDNIIDLLRVKAPTDPRVNALANLHGKKKMQHKSCFPASTRILTPSGYRPIGELEVGDDVLSQHHDGTLVPERISQKLSYNASPVLVVQLSDGSLRTTAHHSLRTVTGWKRAGRLEAGDTLQRVAADGETSMCRVVSLAYETAEQVFNLTTTGAHNFIAEGVLAHNFTELRWLRTLWHQLTVDRFVGATASAPTCTAATG